MRSITAICALLIFSLSASRNVAVSQPRSAEPAHHAAVDVTLVTDEAYAALNILARRKANQPVTEADWQRLFSSEGYLRLKKREAALKRAFEDSDFKAYILSDDLLLRADALSVTLNRWKKAGRDKAALSALRYLPPQARIRAKIYPMIKPRPNSFVFEVDTDPAIFLYLDQEVTNEQFENTLAHEFHHIGYGGTCPNKETEKAISLLPATTQTVLKWVGAFGEGFAMLAAAGGPDVHPHRFSKPEDRERWDRDVANFNDDLRRVEKFFVNVLQNRLDESQTRETAFSFFGVQGPWYTVGWKMAVTIEETYGRAKLIECMCDQRKLLSTFNLAASQSKSKESLGLWSREVVDAVR